MLLLWDNAMGRKGEWLAFHMDASVDIPMMHKVTVLMLKFGIEPDIYTITGFQKVTFSDV